jgi:uncharacterized membrane protein YbhN (UPF0104 family)
MSVLQNPAGKKLTSFLIRCSVTAGMLLLLIRSIDASQSLRSLMMVPPIVLAAALLMQLIGTCVASFRWYLIMRTIGFSHTFSFYWKSYFKGTFFNQALPTSIGGDSVRILDCARDGNSTLEAFSGVFIDRVVGLAGLLLLNITALVLKPSLLPEQIFWVLLFVVSGLFFALIALFHLQYLRFLAGYSWLSPFLKLSERYQLIYGSGRGIAVQLFLSVIVHLLTLGIFYTLGNSVGLNYSFPVYLTLVPPVILLTILPISLAGWGVREGALVGFFLLVGADKSRVVSFSILYGLLILVAALPGLWIYLAQKNRI